jgi:Rrf2 family protein
MKIKQATAYTLHGMIYMVRHMTQLPMTVSMIAKAEGIPESYLAKIFNKLTKAGFIKVTDVKQRGYIFARDPKEINLLELFEVVEGKALFTECFMDHCECGSTPENCAIYATWIKSTRQTVDFLANTDLVTAAWNHPNHHFRRPMKPQANDVEALEQEL